MVRFLSSVLRILSFTALAVFLASFITSNTAEVTVSLFPLPFEMEMPVYVLGLSMLTVGIIAGGAIVSASHLLQTWHDRKARHRAERKMKAVENELYSLRTERERFASSAKTQTMLPPSNG